MRVLTTTLLVSMIVLAGCTSEKQTVNISEPVNNEVIDITNAIFENTSPSCKEYVGYYLATVIDKSNDNQLTSEVNITTDESKCTITSNGIPNHDFAIGGKFVTDAKPVMETFSFTNTPTVSATPTPLTLQYDNAIFLNGAKLDLLAAACYGVGNEPLGKEKIGCGNSDTPWRYDPMHPDNDFGEDANHAHTQPDGAYHYHGDPAAMYDTAGNTASGVIGFAADGFPIRGPYIDDNGTIREVKSGYVLKEGNRTNQQGEGAFPNGTWNGIFRDDFVWQDGVGDLDECNGKIVNGTYTYFVTFSFPWVMGCFKGLPDETFKKGPR